MKEQEFSKAGQFECNRMQSNAIESTRRHSTVLVFLLLGVVALAAAGCRTSVNTVENAEKSGVRETVADKRIVTDPSLYVNVTSLSDRTLASGFKQVQFELTNRRNSDVRIFYAVEWFDENGMVVRSQASGWVERPFVARESIPIVVTAPTATAKDFRIKLVNRP